MKKTNIIVLIMLLSAIFNHSSGRTSAKPLTTGDEPGKVTVLIINAEVNVVLVNNENAMLQVAGTGSLAELITFERTGDTLVIGSTKNRNLKGAATIYVPASQLKNIRINRGADIRSLYPLQTPKLDVIINGACSIAISNIGELNLIETDSYSIDHTVDVRPLPANVLMKK